MTAAKKQAVSYEEAVRGLAAPNTWCRAAEQLATIGDHRALIPLLEAYETPVEGGKRCLLEAMERLRASDAALELFGGDPHQRSQALRLMELFGSDRQLPVLVKALSDPAAGVRSQARESLRNHERTSAWRAAMTKLLEAGDPDVRALAAESLK